MPRKFDQDAKDRVVRLVEDRILAENMSMQAACKAVAPKLGVSHDTRLVSGPSRPVVREASQNLCLKTWPRKTRGYAVKIKSYATPMSY